LGRKKVKGLSPIAFRLISGPVSVAFSAEGLGGGGTGGFRGGFGGGGFLGGVQTALGSLWEEYSVVGTKPTTNMGQRWVQNGYKGGNKAQRKPYPALAFAVNEHYVRIFTLDAGRSVKHQVRRY
jgi:hypothetical protein